MGEGLLDLVQMLMILALTIVAFAALGGHGLGRDGGLDARIRRLERSVDRLSRHVGVETEGLSTQGQPSEAVKDAVRAGHKIEAIRRYREETGAGLKEAKDAVEAWERSSAAEEEARLMPERD